LKAKGLISRKGTAFDMLQSLAESGAVRYHELKARFSEAAKNYPGNVKHSLFDATFYRLQSTAYVQMFVRSGERKRRDRYVAITNEGINALELAEARKARRVASVQKFVKMNNACSPISL
jgi:hypothetical protein